MVQRAAVKVLVVDDTSAQRYVRSKVLSAAGFQVLGAASGCQALALAAQAHVLVLDVFLPDINGFDVCRSLRARADTASMPIIHVSSVSVLDVEVKGGVDAGADAYLIQPVPSEVLIQVVESTLRARRHPRSHVSARTAEVVNPA